MTKIPDTAKEFLSLTLTAKQRMQAAEWRAERLRERLEGMRAGARPVYTTSGRDHSPVEDLLIDLTDANEVLRGAAERFWRLEALAERLLARLPDADERQVLERRYLLRQLIREVAEEMYVSERHANRLQARGLARLEALFPAFREKELLPAAQEGRWPE